MKIHFWSLQNGDTFRSIVQNTQDQSHGVCAFFSIRTANSYFHRVELVQLLHSIEWFLQFHSSSSGMVNVIIIGIETILQHYFGIVEEDAYSGLLYCPNTALGYLLYEKNKVLFNEWYGRFKSSFLQFLLLYIYSHTFTLLSDPLKCVIHVFIQTSCCHAKNECRTMLTMAWHSVTTLDLFKICFSIVFFLLFP